MGEAARTRITSGGRWRFASRLLAACASALVTAGALGAGAPAASASPAADAPSTTPALAASDRVSVTLDGIRPTAPVKGDTVVLSGTVKNTSSKAIGGASVDIRTTGSALASRSAITEVLHRKGASVDDGTAVHGITQKLPAVKAGGSARFTLRAPVSKLRLQDNGVYQLSVEAAAGHTSLGITRTFLPWFPKPADAEATRTATLWPVVDQPRISARTMADEQQTPVFLNDGLTSEMKPDGRLGKIVSLGDSLPVTWVVDPDLALTADAMTRGYRVAAGASATRAGTGGATAQSWLGNLKWSMVTYKDAQQARKKLGSSSPSASPSTTGAPQQPSGSASPSAGKSGSGTSGSGSSAKATTEPSDSSSPSGSATEPNPLDYPHDDLVALPTGDPDLASIAHNGSRIRELPSLLKSAQELSASPSTSLVLGGKPRTDIAWPVDGALDTSIVRTGKQAGASTFIANGSRIGNGGLAYTPDAARQIDGGSAVVADNGLSSLLSGDLSSAPARTTAVQRFLAETLMVTMEAPSKQRTLLVAPPRRMSAATAGVLATALRSADKGGWIDPVSLKDVQKKATTHSRVPSTSGYPGSVAKNELSSSSLAQVGKVHDQLSRMVRVLTQPQRVTGPFNQAMMRTVSTAWRDDPHGAAAYEKATDTYLAGLMNAVKVAPKSGTVTLSGQSATIPITVINNLEQTVRVRVQLISEQPTRVTVGKPHTLTIPARTSRQAEFPTTATTNGKAVLTTQLYDLQGREYGPSQHFTINVTEVGNSVLIVVAIGLLVVVLAIIRMYRKRARRNAEAEAAQAGGDGSGSGDGPGPDGGGEPGGGPDRDGNPEASPDTEPSGTEQPAPNEKVEG